MQSQNESIESASPGSLSAIPIMAIGSMTAADNGGIVSFWSDNDVSDVDKSNERDEEEEESIMEARMIWVRVIGKWRRWCGTEYIEVQQHSSNYHIILSPNAPLLSLFHLTLSLCSPQVDSTGCPLTGFTWLPRLR